MLLKNQVALITGSGRGIGRAMAQLFAKEGASVFLTERTETDRSRPIVSSRRIFPPSSHLGNYPG